jgi:hypothetical protein
MGAAFRKVAVRKEDGEGEGEGEKEEKKDEKEEEEEEREYEPDNAPFVRVPDGTDGKTKLLRFLPENFLEVSAYQDLLTHAQKFGIEEEEIQVLFLRLCSPYDVSLGTVVLKRFFREFDPRFRKLLRRIVLQRAKGLPRMLFEDVARFVLDLCAMDYGNLVLKTLSSLREFEVLDVVNVRAIVRYMTGDGDMSTLLRLFAAHLFSQPSAPYHHFSAFVQLAVRYPALVCVSQRWCWRRRAGAHARAHARARACALAHVRGRLRARARSLSFCPSALLRRGSLPFPSLCHALAAATPSS